jgi:KGK domain
MENYNSCSLESDDVILVSEEDQVHHLHMPSPTFLVSELYQRVFPTNHTFRTLIDLGVKCRILRPGQNWQTGRLKVSVSFVFCPDETDASAQDSTGGDEERATSPLDEFRPS